MKIMKKSFRYAIKLSKDYQSVEVSEGFDADVIDLDDDSLRDYKAMKEIVMEEVEWGASLALKRALGQPKDSDKEVKKQYEEDISMIRTKTEIEAERTNTNSTKKVDLSKLKR